MVEPTQTGVTSTPERPSGNRYRVNTTQRLLLVVGMVAIAVNWMAVHTIVAVISLDVIAVIIGLGAWVTASRVHHEKPCARYITLGISPTILAGNHVKVAFATGQEPHWLWVISGVIGFLLTAFPVAFVIYDMIRNHKRVSTSNLVVHHLSDLTIIGVSTVGGLIVLQFVPLVQAGQSFWAVLTIVASNVGLVTLGAAIVIGRRRIPALQLGLALSVIGAIIGDVAIAQHIDQVPFVTWTVTAYQAFICLPLIIAMTMSNPHEGFETRFALEPTNTLRAGIIGLWVVLFLCLPFFVELNISISLWSVLVSLVMCLLAIRMWTLIGERDHKLAQRYLQQQQLRHKISHDPLTDLWSRSVMEDHFSALNVGLSNPAVLVYVRALGVDVIRDIYGHRFGDEAINIIAHTLAEPVEDHAEVFQFRREEFIIIFKPPATLDAAEEQVQAMVTRISDAVLSNHQPLKVAIHAGLVIVDTYRDFEDGIRWGEVAVNELREPGNHIVRVGPEHIAQVAHVTVTDQRLREAMRNDAFYLVYQPIMNTLDHHCVGFEAFARWRNSDVPPAIFVKSLEQVGLADTFGRWVLQEATKFAASIKCPVSVNISISHIQNSSFVTDVRQALKRSGLPPEYLTIEFSEHDLSIDLTRLMMSLTQVHDLGVRIAIDDVGTGGLTMAQISRLPIEFIKIDQMLISKAFRYDDSRQLLFNVTDMAIDLGMDIIAEGVESNQVLNLVIAGGAHQAQGWLWTKELSPDDATQWWTFLSMREGAINE
ncbi:GGDEF domain-containing phosphodiesterase [Stomatohabitans albus]|uniref:GGDEF domain-containing phosphodiesterase n=1 Tax=Stomatohabitans albus TaxID=3110766 RepID=UPI00300CEDF5